jgi:hypothetical protein
MNDDWIGLEVGVNAHFRRNKNIYARESLEPGDVPTFGCSPAIWCPV